MPRRKIAKRSRVKPFLKTINLNHLMPTRYNIDLDLSFITDSKKAKNNKIAKKNLKKLLENKYQSGKNKWFFSKLRF
jgi:large subunit ribosomal protein L27e